MFGEGKEAPPLPAATSTTPTDELHCGVLARLPVRLFEGQDRDLYPLIKDNLVKGTSIVFHRYHKRRVKFICSVEYDPEDPDMQKISMGSLIQIRPLDGIYHRSMMARVDNQELWRSHSTHPQWRQGQTR